ncbi:MAG TPA: hypothetical protein VGX28_10475 [Frankiaceae bacterium]|nr:hypothetical protein [Frankiaceae bacterium]
MAEGSPPRRTRSGSIRSSRERSFASTTTNPSPAASIASASTSREVHSRKPWPARSRTPRTNDPSTSGETHAAYRPAADTARSRTPLALARRRGVPWRGRW